MRSAHSPQRLIPHPHISALNVVAAPGHQFDQIKITADLDSKGAPGAVACQAFVEGNKFAVGQAPARAEREVLISSFQVPKEVKVVHLTTVGEVTAY